MEWRFEVSKLVQLQDDLYAKLLSEPLLAQINIVQERKLTLENETDATLIWTTLRNGRKGCGILVEMPGIAVKSPNLPGPEHFYSIQIVVMEEPMTNFGPSTGTLQDAESVAERVLQCLCHVTIGDIGSIYAAATAIRPTQEFPGVLAYRIALEMRSLIDPTGKTPLPAIAETAGEITLTPGAATDAIYYTTDDSFPGSGNAAAQAYSAPFTVPVGTVVRYAAYRAGLFGSDIGRVTVT
jgi:hypothetical protein